MKSTTAPASAKHNWTAFELLMLAPFGLLLWYVETQPLVLPAAPPPAMPSVAATVPLEQAAVAPAVPVVDPDAPVFVAAGTTVLQRIAPVARLVLETQVEVGSPQEPVLAPVPETPVAAPQPAVAVVAEPVAAEPQAEASMRIEVTDGTGTDGFAREIAVKLEKSGVTVSKTVSMAAGTQRRTVILYRDGFEEDARRLSKLFARPPALVNNTRSRHASDASDVRLVLGSAAVREKELLASRGVASSM